MESVGYKSWGLIIHDANPTTEVRQSSSPPMMTVVAIDRQSSLVFEFRKEERGLTLKAEATAMSAESLSADLFAVYTGPTEDSYREVPGLSWDKANEGMYTVFSTRIDAARPLLKLLYVKESTLVLNQVQFLTGE